MKTSPLHAHKRIVRYVQRSAPRCRKIRVGSAWQTTVRSGLEYISLALNFSGTQPLRVNTFADKDNPSEYSLAPLAGGE